MKIVITATGKEYELAVGGFYDTVESQLSFRVLKDNHTLDEMYADFNDGDTSSLKFVHTNGDLAWAKNGYTELKDFHPMPNQKIGKDPNTDADKFADVVEITLTTENYNKRISDAEDAIKKLSISTLTAAKVMDEKAKAVDELITNANNTLNNVTNTSDTLKSSTGEKIDQLINDGNTQMEALVQETRNKLDQYMAEMDSFMAEIKIQISSLVDQFNNPSE